MNKLYLLLLFVMPHYIYSQQSLNQESDSIKTPMQEINMQEGIEQLLQKNKQSRNTHAERNRTITKKKSTNTL